jgi:flagellar biosynthesis/type III secretory pathway M-ring protein FliF/YscJ
MRPSIPGRKKEEAEKPFWISFSDMMTALMVLFLVVMTVALLAVTNTVSATERAKHEREEEISRLMERVREMADAHPGVTLRGQTIDFGDQARFDTDSSLLTPVQEKHLRAFVPGILEMARTALAWRAEVASRALLVVGGIREPEAWAPISTTSTAEP